MSREESFFIPVNKPNSAISSLLKIISNVYLNGGALFYSFKVMNDKIFHSVTRKPSNIEDIIIHEEVLPSLTELDIELPLEVKPNFMEINIVDFKTQIFNSVSEGGAYSQYTGNVSKLNKIIEEFCTTLFKEHINEVKVYYSSKAWSEWFGDMKWDSTWIFFDKVDRKIHILCITDMD